MSEKVKLTKKSSQKSYYDDSEKLSKLIKRANEHTRKGDEQLVYWDKRTGKKVEKNLFGTFGMSVSKKDVVTYRLHYHLFARLDIRHLIYLENSEKLADLEIEGSYAIKDGGEIDLVRFYHYNSDKDIFRKRVTEWIEEYVDRQNPKGKALNKYKKDFVSFLEKKAEEIGLKFNLTIDIRNERSGGYKKADFPISVNLQNGNKANLKVTALLSLKDIQKAVGFYREGGSVDKLISKTILDAAENLFFNKSLDQIIHGFKSSIQNQLLTKLENELSKIGYGKKQLSISLDGDVDDFSFELNSKFETNDNRIDIRLQVFIEGDIPDFKSSRIDPKLLNQGRESINKLIQEHAVSVLQLFIGDYKVQDLKIDHLGKITEIDDKELGNKVEQQLITAIENKYQVANLHCAIRSLRIVTERTKIQFEHIVIPFFQSRERRFTWLDIAGKAQLDSSQKWKIMEGLSVLSTEITFQKELRRYIGEYSAKREKGEIFKQKEELSGLQKHLISSFSELGVDLFLTANVIEESAADIEVTESVEVKMPKDKSLDHFVRVMNRVSMELTNEHDFVQSEVQNIGRWTRDLLRKVIRKELGSKTYLDLVLNFYGGIGEQGYEQLIEDKVREAANSIGYKASNISFIPKVDELELITDGFSFEIGGEDGIDFHTKEHRISARLNIQINGKISNFKNDRIKKYIKPSSSITLIDKMKQRVEEKVRQYLHTVEPERYYLRFFVSSDTEDSVELELINVVGRILESEFSATDLSITPKGLETELSTRYDELIRDIHRIDIGDKLGKIKAKIGFQVTGLNGNEGWIKFKIRKDIPVAKEALEIGEIIRNYIELELNSGSEDHILTIQEEAAKDLKVKMGYEIQFVDLKGEKSLADKKILEIRETQIEDETAEILQPMKIKGILREHEIEELKDSIKDYNQLVRIQEDPENPGKYIIPERTIEDDEVKKNLEKIESAKQVKTVNSNTFQMGDKTSPNIGSRKQLKAPEKKQSEEENPKDDTNQENIEDNGN